MSINYGEMERQFLETLKADSGRTLDEWMAAITAEGLTHRNDIIDWLRRQGFMFAKASWLERIHNNGGKPVYSDAGKARTGKRPEPRPESPPATALPTATKLEPNPRPTAPPVLRVVSSSPQAPPAAAAPPPEPGHGASVQSVIAAEAEGDPAAIDAIVARAKAYRPLAAYVIAETRKQVPGAAVLPRDGYLVFRSGVADFALLSVNAKELRLGLALKNVPSGSGLEPAKLPALRSAPPMSHMIVLTDARQVTPALLAAIAQAASNT